MDVLEPLQSFEQAILRIIQYLIELSPRIIIALLVLVLGWVAAGFIRRGTVVFLKWIRAESLAERSGVENFLLRGGVPYTTTTIVSQLVYWTFLAFVVLAGLDILGLNAVTGLMTTVLMFIPRLLLAFVFLLFGLMLAKFIRTALKAWLNNLNVGGADLIANVAHFTFIVLIVCVALEHLEIGGQVILNAFLMAFGALCLAIGISFGLAGRRHAQDLLDKIFGGRK